MQISVKSDVDKALKSMRGLQRKQMPFAAALGLTMTAKKVAKVKQRMMVRKLDRQTPFTIKGVRWQGASKNDFKSEEFPQWVLNKYWPDVPIYNDI